MTPEQAKALQKQNARLRSQQTPRRSSQQAISSETQSEVTERAPNLYRVPQINVPDDLQGVARLIQKELQKIEASQSILLSLWQKLQGQFANKDSIEFTKLVVFDENPEVEGNFGWNCIPKGAQSVYGADMNAAPWGWARVNGQTVNTPVEGQATYGTVLTMSSGGTEGFATPEDMRIAAENGTAQQCWVQQVLWNTSGAYYIRFWTNDGVWAGWLEFSEAYTLEEIKKEIYAELLELNPGIVVPVVDTPQE